MSVSRLCCGNGSLWRQQSSRGTGKLSRSWPHPQKPNHAEAPALVTRVKSVQLLPVDEGLLKNPVVVTPMGRHRTCRGNIGLASSGHLTNTGTPDSRSGTRAGNGAPSAGKVI